MKKLTLIIFAISVVGCSGYSFRSWDDTTTGAELEYIHRSKAFLESKKNASLRCENVGKKSSRFKGYELQHISTINRTIEERNLHLKENHGLLVNLYNQNMDKKSIFLCICRPKPCVKTRSDYVGGGGS